MSHFALGPKKSSLSHFNCFAIPGPVAPSADHKVSPKKNAVSLLFCPFLRFLGLKRLRSPVLEFSTHAFFRKNCAFFEPSIAFVTATKAWVELTPKSTGNEKNTERGPKNLFRLFLTFYLAGQK